MKTGMSLAVAYAALLTFASVGAVPVPKVILDTDIGGDYDDIGAMAAMRSPACRGPRASSAPLPPR